MMVFCLGLRKVMSLLAEDRFCLGERTGNAGEDTGDLRPFRVQRTCSRCSRRSSALRDQSKDAYDSQYLLEAVRW
jgi:hypothetical protein